MSVTAPAYGETARLEGTTLTALSLILAPRSAVPHGSVTTPMITTSLRSRFHGRCFGPGDHRRSPMLAMHTIEPEGNSSFRPASLFFDLTLQCDRMPICQICLNLGNEGLKILSCNRGLVVEEAKNFDSAFCSIYSPLLVATPADPNKTSSSFRIESGSSARAKSIGRSP